MAFTLIENQVLNLAAIPEDDSACCDGSMVKETCALVQNDDALWLQVIQACCESGSCGNLSNFGDELITDGDFEVDPSDSWTGLPGWAWDGHKITHTPNDVAACVIQDLHGTDYEDICCESFQIIIEVSDYEAGTLTIMLGGTIFGTIQADGTYKFYGKGGCDDSDFKICYSVGFIGSVDNVSVKKVGPCWTTCDWDVTITDGGAGFAIACHTTGNTSSLTMSGTNIVLGRLYKIVYKITGMTAGSLTPAIGTDEGLPRTSNGVFTDYIRPTTSTDLTFTPSSDFDGCFYLTETGICTMPTNNAVELKNADGVHMKMFEEGSGINYYKDRMLVQIAFPMEIVEDDGTVGVLPFGCYNLCVTDACQVLDGGGTTLITNGSFTGSAAGWNVTLWTYSANSVHPQFTGIPGYLTQNIAIVNKKQYFVKVTISGQSNFAGGDYLQIGLGTNNIGAGGNYTTVTGNGTFVVPLDTLPLMNGTYVSFKNFGAFNGTIDDIGVYAADDPAFTQYCSQCINYQEEHECTKIFLGLCDEDGSLGFEWSSGFYLQARLRAVFAPTKYPSTESTYKYSSGLRSRPITEIEKSWDLIFSEVDQPTHDMIRALIKCDHFSILKDFIHPQTEYFCITKEYEPAWDKKGLKNVAESVIEVQRASNTIKNNSC